MNILYVSSSIGKQFGGGERFIKNFIELQPQHTHSFIGSSQPMHEVFKEIGFKHVYQSGGFEPVIPINILLIPISILLGIINIVCNQKLYKQAGIIISPTSFTELFFVIPWVKFFFKKKVIFMIHNNRCPKIFKLPIIRNIVTTFFGKSAVVFVSSSQKKMWNDCGINPKNSHLILNGAHVTNFTSIIKSKNDIIHIGFLSRIHKEKRLNILLQALVLLRTSKKIVVNIGGDGTDKLAMQRLQRMLHIPENISIIWHGSLLANELSSFYQMNNFMVFPSSREGFALTLVEAWERGIPVITSNIEPFIEAQEILLTHANRLIFKLDDVVDLAQKIQMVIDNINYYSSSEMQLLLHNNAETHFSLSNVIKKYQSLFNSAQIE